MSFKIRWLKYSERLTLIDCNRVSIAAAIVGLIEKITLMNLSLGFFLGRPILLFFSIRLLLL